MDTRIVTGLSLFFVLFATLASGQAVAAVDPKKIDELFSDYDHTDTPGCSVGVIRDGELIHARGYGMANLDLGVDLTPRSVFRIGSTSKQFAAAAVLLLARRGKLSLDDDVRTWVPELRAYEQPVTVRQFIHHTSGYREYLTLWGLAGKRGEDWVSDAETVALLARQRELNFPPGTGYLYSNSGYFLLSQVVRSASGKSLREWSQEAIFGPLAMKKTHFHDDHTEIVQGRATGYAPREGGGFSIDTTTLDMVGGGGLFTSVEDLVAWDQAFYDDRLGEGFTEQMLTTAVLQNGNSTGYAFGLRVGEYRGLAMISHGGAFAGYRADIIRFPDQRLSVICLCNRADGNPSNRAQHVADLYLAEYLAKGVEAAAAAKPEGPVVLSEADLAARLGAYKPHDQETVIRIEKTEKGLAYVSSRTMSLRALSADRFVVEGTTMDVVMEFNAPVGQGRSGFRMVFDGSRERFFDPLRQTTTPTAEQVAGFAGSYECPELDNTLRLTASGTSLLISHAEPHRSVFDHPLEPTNESTFSGGGLILEFPSRGTAPQELRLHLAGVRNLRCVRN